MPVLTEGRERRRDRRGLLTAVLALLAAPFLLSLLLYAVLRWGPIPAMVGYRIGSLMVVREQDGTADGTYSEGLTSLEVDTPSGIKPAWVLKLGERCYSIAP